VEDIEALIDKAGGSAFVYGISSGAALALEAAARLNGKVRALALYEPPYGSSAIQGNGPDDYGPKLNRPLAEGKHGEAVDLFMGVVGTPPDMIAGMHQSPIWPVFEAVAPTLACDAACMNGAIIPFDRAARIQAPTLAMNGGEGFDFMGITAKVLAETIPNASYLAWRS
jgi:pimeloyl-ACP methyl ester carboxylesterase